MLTPGNSEAVADLAHCRIGRYCLHDCGQDVFRAFRAVLEAGKRGGPSPRIALGPNAPNALHLRSLCGGVDALDGRRTDGTVVGEPVDPDDDLVPPLDR